MKRIRRTIELGLIAVLANVMSCATDGSPTGVDDIVNTVVVNLGLTTLTVGQTIQADAIARSTAGGTLTGVTLTWATSNSNVVIVSAAGMVTAIGPGHADIIASAGNQSARVTVTVNATIGVGSVSVTLSSSEIGVNESVTATATARDGNNAVIGGRTFDWTTSNAAVATISPTGLITPTGVGTTEIVATSEGVSGQATLTVHAGVAAVAVQLTSAAVAPGQATTALATLRDAANNVLSDRPVTWNSSDVSVATVTSSGQVQAVTPGTTSISATSEGVSGSAVLTVRAAVGSVTVTLGNSTLNVGGTTTATAVVKDPNNNILTDRLIVWTSANNAVASVTSLGAVTAIATGSANIIATVEGVQGSAPLVVNTTGGGGGGGVPAALVITTPPNNVTSGVNFAPAPVVEIRDGANALVTTATNTVTVVANGGIVTGTTSLPAVGGKATFSNLRINGSGAATLTFSSAGLTAATSGAFTVNGPPATKLSITTQPAPSANSGIAFSPQPVIQLLDASDNAVSQAGVVVTAAIATGGGTLGGTFTAATNAGGAATFSGLNITGNGTHTIVFTSANLASVTSASINVSGIVATKLSITTQPPATATSGAVFVPQPSIQLRDASDNAVSQPNVVVTAAIASGTGALAGTMTATTNASGVATFVGLNISGLGAHTLRFTSPNLTQATSSTITIAAGAPSKLTITTQPSSSAASGAVFATQPVIQLRDASNNAVSQAGVSVTAAIATGTGTLAGTTTATTDASGAATFSGLNISGSGAHTLRFTSTGLTQATSSTITISAGPPSKLTITTQPSALASSGLVFAAQPAIQVRDASNNAVGQAGITVTVAIATGSGTLGGTTTASTNANGVATFAGLNISGSGPHTLQFTAPGLTSITSSTITVGAGAAAKLSITTQPSATAASGAAFATQPVIQLRDASDNAVSQANVTVTAAVATGTGTLGGTLTATTNASGVATFAGLNISGSGAHTLAFTATGLTQATSSTITVSAPTASKLSIATQPSSSVQNGLPLAQQPVIQLADASNNPIAQAGVVVTAAIASGGGSLGGTTTATTNASGVATFTGLAITGTTGARTLSFTSAPLTAATSSSITVSAGPASQIVITTQPSAAVLSGVVFAAQPVVRLRDVSDNNVSQAGVTITASIVSGTGTLGGTTTASTNSSGTATFTNLSISGTAGPFTLRFSSGSLTPATSGTITISLPPTPTQLTITTQPSTSATSGVAFGAQPLIQLRDASNNAVAQSGVIVTVAIATGGGTLGGTTTASTNASGIATFTNLSITGTAGSRTISFTAPPLTSVTSNAISISAGSAGGLYPNRPPSYANSTEINFSQSVPTGNPSVDNPISGTDWLMWGFDSPTNWTRITDATAPQSPSDVFRGHWAAGDYGNINTGGHGIGNVFTYGPGSVWLSNPVSRMYVSLRVYFDMDPSQWHPISNKFVNITGNRSLILVQLNEGGNWRHAEELGPPSFFVDDGNSVPNETHLSGQVDNRPVPTRQWVQFEVLIDIPNHVFRVWQDGVLTTNATPSFLSTSIKAFAVNAFRGGGGEQLSADINWRYDHFFVAW